MIALESKDRERIAFSWALSFGITAAVLVLFIFIRLTRDMPVNTPMELFVEVNYGTDNVGSGSIQTFNKPSDSKVAENMKPEPEKEVKSVATPKPVPPTPRTEEVKKAPVKAVEKPVITSKTESPVEEKERPETKKTASASASAANTPAAKPAPEKQINKDALFSKSKGGSAGSNGTNGTASGVGGNNNGDDASGVGDKGAKDGSLYAKSYSGGGGGGGTAVGLNLNGWSWNRRPVVDDNSDATGDIVFKITVDKHGKVKNVIQLSSTVTDYAVVNQYRNAVRASTFVAKSANVPEESVGTITFKIRAK